MTTKEAWKIFWKQMKTKCGGFKSHMDSHEFTVSLEAAIKAFAVTNPTSEQIILYADTCVAMYNFAYS